MDFGDILDSWEKEQKESSKKTSRSTGQEWRNKKLQPEKTARAEKPTVAQIMKKKGPSIDPMTEWMRRYGVVDKDAAAEKAEAEQQKKDRSWLHDMPYEAQIDLHGLTGEEARERLNLFITECCRRKLQKVLIIHGKGNHSEDGPVLSGMVRSFIERDYRLGESGHPEKKDGGKGATWVIIRDSAHLQ